MKSNKQLQCFSKSTNSFLSEHLFVGFQPFTMLHNFWHFDDDLFTDLKQHLV